MTQIKVKVIHINDDEMRPIMKIKTVKILEKLKQFKPKEDCKHGEHTKETYNEVVVRLLKELSLYK